MAVTQGAALLGSALLGVGRSNLSYLIPSVEVFDGVTVGESTVDSVRARLSGFEGIVNEGTFAYTGGHLINVGLPSGEGIAQEEGLRLISLGFGLDKTLVSAIQFFDRGYQDSQVDLVIDRIVERYQVYGRPIFVNPDDRDTDTKDRYVIFDLGRYLVVIDIPESSLFIRVKVVVREIYEEMIKADRTAGIILPYLQRGMSSD